MVDVLLVLLIFFMSITSTEVLRNVKELELPNAKNAGEKNKKSNQVVINVTWLAATHSGSIIVDNKNYPDPMSMVPMLRQRFEANPMVRVLLRADKAVEYQTISEVMKACSSAGIANVTFAVTQGGAEGGSSASAEKGGG